MNDEFAAPFITPRFPFIVYVLMCICLSELSVSLLSSRMVN